MFCILALSDVPGVGQVLEGKILEDHSSLPLAAVQIQVRSVGGADVVADLVSDSSGRFSASDLPVGEYLIELRKRNYLKAIGRFNVPAPFMAIRMLRYGSIEGRVFDSRGSPVGSASVFPMVESGAGTLRKVGLAVSVMTDDRGAYRVSGLPPGRYALGFAWRVTDSETVSSICLYPSNAQPAIFAISGGEEYRGVDLIASVNASHKVAGNVQLPWPGGSASVALIAVDRPELALAVVQADAQGRFHLGGVPSGSYELLAVAPVVGFGGRGVLVGPDALFGRVPVEVDGQDVDGVSVSLDSGRSARFVLLAAATPGSMDECPSTATMVLTPVEGWGAMLSRSVELSSGKEQVVEGLAPARYYLEVTKLAERCFPVGVKMIDLNTAADSGSVPVRLAAAGAIRGVLTDAAAHPRDFVVVLLKSEAHEVDQPVQISLPDATSRFAFPTLPPGRYRIAGRPVTEGLSTRWAGDQERMFEIEVPAGEPVEVDLPAPVKGEFP